MSEHVKLPSLTLEGARGLKDIGPPPMVIEELLPIGAITLVSGQPYSGKTFFALEAARAVATDTPFMGKWKVSRPGNVLIVEQDSPKYDTGRALWSMLAKQYEEEGDSARESEGSSIVDPIQIAWHPGLDLSQALDCERIIQTANRLYTWRGWSIVPYVHVDAEGNVTTDQEETDFGYTGASLIILDSSRSLHRAKENESDDMERVIQNVKRIREKTGAAIILIAHDNASGEKTRGSTAIPAGVDSEYSVTKRKRQGDHGVYVRKARAIAPLEYRYTITTTEEKETIKTVSFKEFIQEAEETEDEEDRRAELMHFISLGPKELQADLEPWAASHGLAGRTVAKWLAEAKGTGYLNVTYRNAGRARFAVYSVKGA